MRVEYLLLLPLSLLLFIVYMNMMQVEMAFFGIVASSTTAFVEEPADVDVTTPSSRCPRGGVWSEWTTIGHCPTTCGACSVAPRMRECTTRCGDDCPCEGPSMDVGPCGLALCPFPSTVGTCCSPSCKAINERTQAFFCGAENVAARKCAL